MVVVQPVSKERGSLFVVSTPIGNLGDVTYRAVETLKKVSLIAAEDTRRTKILLNRYQIHTPLSSYNSFNKFKKGDMISRFTNDVEFAYDSSPVIIAPH